MCSACFPRLSLAIDASLSSTGSSEASSPASTVLSRHYDFLPPIPPHFVSFAWWYLGCTRCIRSSADGYHRRGLELINPVTPTGILPRRRQDLPSSRRTQMSVCTCSSTPAGLLTPDLIRSSSVAHAMTKAKAPCDLSISELNSMAFGLAVYASQSGLPSTTQDSLPAAGQALPDGLSTRRVPTKGFKDASLHAHPPLPSLAWRNVMNSLPAVQGLILVRTSRRKIRGERPPDLKLPSSWLPS